MLRFLALLTPLFLLPIAGAAQAVPPIQRGPMPAFQSNPGAAGNHGITVNGTAALRIPATAAHLALTVTTPDRRMTLDKARLQPLVEAIVKAGADPGTVQLPPNFNAAGGSNVATITATFSHPTVAQMQQGIISVGSVIAGEKDLALSSAAVQLVAADCAGVLNQVRRQAVEHARAKALSLASDLGVHIGGAINVTSYDQLAADGSCSSTYYINGFGGFNNPQSPQSPGDYVTIPATANVTITYAIK
jgi:uncharacterized protein YggE